MEEIMKVIAWLKTKNITSHSVAAVIVLFAAAYNTDEQFRDMIGKFFVGYPVVITKLGIITVDIVAVATMWAKYSHSTTPAARAEMVAKEAAVNPAPPTQP